jgi:acyl carrier protein
MDIFKRVREIIAESEGINIDLILIESDLLLDLGMDSLSFAGLMVVIEENFEVKFRNLEFKNFVKVKDIVRNLEQKIKVD